MDKPKRKDIPYPGATEITKLHQNDCYSASNKTHDEYKEYFKYLLSKIPSDDAINDSAITGFATSYYQGKFDTLMDLICEVKHEG
jgi:hypothetical protein